MRSTIATLIALPLATAVAMPATAATRSFPVPGFVKLRVDGPYTVRVHTGASHRVVATGPQSRIDKLVVESRGDTLLVTTEKGSSWRELSWGKGDTVYVDIAVPMLEAAELTGSGDVNVDKIRTRYFTATLTGSGDLSIARLETSRLKATLTGSGDLSIAGKTGRAELSLTGSGDLRGSGLAVDLLTASALGSGDIGVGPTRVAKARIAGSGDISIAGRPNCTTSKSGSGDISCGD